MGATEVETIGVKLTLDAGGFVGQAKEATSAMNTFQQAAAKAGSGAAGLKAGGGRQAATGLSGAQQLAGVNVSLTVSAAELGRLRKTISTGLGVIPVTIEPKFATSGRQSIQNVMGSMLSTQYGISQRAGTSIATRAIERDLGSLPHKAHGGPVQQGRPVIVGERRSEVFVPKTDGRIERDADRWYREQERVRRREAEIAALNFQQQRRHEREMGRHGGGPIHALGGRRVVPYGEGPVPATSGEPWRQQYDIFRGNRSMPHLWRDRTGQSNYWSEQARYKNMLRDDENYQRAYDQHVADEWRRRGRVRGGGVQSHGGKYGVRPGTTQGFADYQNALWGSYEGDRGWLYHSTPNLSGIRSGGVQPLSRSYSGSPISYWSSMPTPWNGPNVVRSPQSGFSSAMSSEIFTSGSTVPRSRLQYWGEDNDWHRFRRGRARHEGGPAHAIGGRRVAPLPPGTSMPPVLGTAPLREGYVRAYHYTKPTFDPSIQRDIASPAENLASIRQHGMKISKGIGETYGEPNAMWFSNDPAGYDKRYSVEAHLPQRWFHGYGKRRSSDPWTVGGPSSNMAVAGDVSRRRLASYSEPWMHTYRYMAKRVGETGGTYHPGVYTPGGVMREIGSNMSSMRGEPRYADEALGYDQFVADSWRARKHRAGGGLARAQDGIIPAGYQDYINKWSLDIGKKGKAKPIAPELAAIESGTRNYRAFLRIGELDPKRAASHRMFYEREAETIRRETEDLNRFLSGKGIKQRLEPRSFSGIVAGFSSSQQWEDANIGIARDAILAHYGLSSRTGFGSGAQHDEIAAILAGNSVTGIKRSAFSESFWEDVRPPVDRWVNRVMTLETPEDLLSRSTPEIRDVLGHAAATERWRYNGLPTPEVAGDPLRRAADWVHEQVAAEAEDQRRHVQAEGWGWIRDLAGARGASPEYKAMYRDRYIKGKGGIFRPRAAGGAAVAGQPHGLVHPSQNFVSSVFQTAADWANDPFMAIMSWQQLQQSQKKFAGGPVKPEPLGPLSRRLAGLPYPTPEPLPEPMKEPEWLRRARESRLPPKIYRAGGGDVFGGEAFYAGPRDSYKLRGGHKQHLTLADPYRPQEHILRAIDDIRDKGWEHHLAIEPEATWEMAYDTAAHNADIPEMTEEEIRRTIERRFGPDAFEFQKNFEADKLKNRGFQRFDPRSRLTRHEGPYGQELEWSPLVSKPTDLIIAHDIGDEGQVAPRYPGDGPISIHNHPLTPGGQMGLTGDPFRLHDLPRPSATDVRGVLGQRQREGWVVTPTQTSIVRPARPMRAVPYDSFGPYIRRGIRGAGLKGDLDELQHDWGTQSSNEVWDRAYGMMAQSMGFEYLRFPRDISKIPEGVFPEGRLPFDIGGHQMKLPFRARGGMTRALAGLARDKGPGQHMASMPQWYRDLYGPHIGQDTVGTPRLARDFVGTPIPSVSSGFINPQSDSYWGGPGSGSALWRSLFINSPRIEYALQKRIFGDRSPHRPYKMAGGGNAGEGMYIVGEIGKELFVPNRLSHLIPKHVMEQIPQRAGGGIVEIGKKRNELFSPPEDGIIVPNRLIDQIPHAEEGRLARMARGLGRSLGFTPPEGLAVPDDEPPSAYSLRPGGKWDSYDAMRRAGDPTDPTSRMLAGPRGRAFEPSPAFGVGSGYKPTSGPVNVAQATITNTGSINAPQATVATQTAAGGAGAAKAQSAAGGAPGAAAGAAGEPPPGFLRFGRLQYPEHMQRNIESWANPASGEGMSPEEIYAAMKSLGGAQAEGVTLAPEAADPKVAAMITKSREFSAGLAGMTAQMSSWQQVMSGRTPKGLVAQLSSVGIGGRREMFALQYQAKEQQRALNIAVGGDPTAKAKMQEYIDLHDKLKGERGADAEATKAQIKAIEDGTDATYTAEEVQAGLPDRVKKGTAAWKDLSKTLEKLQPTTGSIVRNLATVIGATSMYGLVMQGASFVMGTGIGVAEKFADELSGWQSTATKTTSALGELVYSTHGNIGATYAQVAVNAGLSKSMMDYVKSATEATAISKAAAKAQGETSGLYRTTLASQRGRPPEGLNAGFGGVLGTALLAEQMGGQKGFIEQIAGDLGKGAGGVDTPLGNSADFGQNINYAIQYLSDSTFRDDVNQKSKGSSAPQLGQLADFLGGAGDFFRTAGQVSHDVIDKTGMMNPAAGPMADVANWFQGIFPKSPADTQAGGPWVNPAYKGKTIAENVGEVMYVADLNRAGKTGAEAAGHASKGLLRLAKSQEEITKAANAANAAGLSYAATLAKAGYVMADAANEVVTSKKELTQAFVDMARGKTLIDPKVWAESNLRQMEANRQVRTKQTERTTDLEIPYGILKSLLTNPLMPAGAGMFPGSAAGKPSARAAGASASAVPGIQAALASSAQSNVNLQALAVEGRNQAFENVRVNAPAQLPAFKAAYAAASAASSAIYDLTASMNAANLAASQANWSNQIRLANRALGDALGLLGKVGGTRLGQLQREQYLNQRASTQLGLQLQQRQITANLALAQFQAPGETGEERYYRQQEAIIKAGIEQKQLNYAKVDYTLSGKIWSETAQRAATDAQAVLGVMQKARDAELQSFAATEAIGKKQMELAAHIGAMDAIMAEATGNWDDILSTVQKGLGEFAGSLDKGVEAVYEALGYTVSKDKLGRNVFEPSSAPVPGVIPGADLDSGSAPLPSPRTDSGSAPGDHAAGFLGNVSSATSMTVGEAGTETVAVLRNPRSAQFSSQQAAVDAASSLTVPVALESPSVVNVAIMDSSIAAWMKAIQTSFPAVALTDKTIKALGSAVEAVAVGVFNMGNPSSASSGAAAGYSGGYGGSGGSGNGVPGGGSGGPAGGAKRGGVVGPSASGAAAINKAVKAVGPGTRAGGGTIGKGRLSPSQAGSGGAPGMVTEMSTPGVWKLCGMAAGAMLLDKQTHGGIQLTAEELSYISGTGLYPKDGTTFTDVGRGFGTMGQGFQWRYGVSQGTIVAALKKDYGLIAQGNTGALPDNLRSTSFRGPHGVYVDGIDQSGSRVTVFDPLRTGPIAWPIGALMSYMHALKGGAVAFEADAYRDKSLKLASGALRTYNTPTDLTVGEAGNETVAVLRNPRAMDLNSYFGGYGGGSGGGSGSPSITVNINGPVVRGEQDIHQLAREVAVEVERSLSRRGQMLGLRGPSV